ncbi:hypothetical protein GCM10023322_39780 [Rugosimonospora acidiphila]|uniref:non-specific serine/threonine protein kinase n=1 Tax=Rugosimonospora acidiphila TaxID=556531 RepID=A0ABP9RX40_9ACTN
MSIEPLVPDLPGYGDVTLISTGSSSLVFRAVQTRLSRTVAIKVLLVDGDSALQAMYQRELETTVLLSSQPHIVGIIDTGTTSAGNPYIVMEYCPGGSYAQILRQRGPLPVDEVVDVGMKVAEALQAAHDVGVLHRDVKPSNILRSAFGPSLADFGIARAPHMLSSTMSVNRMTPHHASPEAMRKDDQTAASDLYSLASTMWQLLTGQPPFVDAKRTDLDSLRQRVLNEPARPVPRPDVPSWLQHELLTALAKDPAARHPSAAAFAEALRFHAYNTPTGAPASAPPAMPAGPVGAPMSGVPQQYAQQYPPQQYAQQYPLQGYGQQYPLQGYPSQPYSPLVHPQQEYPQQEYPQQAPAVPQPPAPPQAYQPQPPAYQPPPQAPVQPQAYPPQPPVVPHLPAAMASAPPAAPTSAPRDAFRWPSAAPTRRDEPVVEQAAPVLDPAAKEAAGASTILWHDSPAAESSAGTFGEPAADGAEPDPQPAGPDHEEDANPPAEEPDDGRMSLDDLLRPIDEEPDEPGPHDLPPAEVSNGAALTRPTELRPTLTPPHETQAPVSAPPTPSYPVGPVSSPPGQLGWPGEGGYSYPSGQPMSGPPMSGPPMSGPPMSGMPMSGPPMSVPPLSGPPISGDPFAPRPMSGSPMSNGPMMGGPMSGAPSSGGPYDQIPRDRFGNPAPPSRPGLEFRKVPVKPGRPRSRDSERPRIPLVAIGAFVGLIVFVVIGIKFAAGGDSSKPNSANVAGVSPQATAVNSPAGKPSAAKPPAGKPPAAKPPTGKPNPTVTANLTHEGAPTDVKLTDKHTSITLTWTDPAHGTVQFYVLGAPAPNVPALVGSVPAGTTTYTQDGVNTSVDYCYTVAAIYSASDYAISPQVCTNRRK